MPATQVRMQFRHPAVTIFVIAMIMYSLHSCVSAQTQTDLEPPRDPVPQVYFGLHIHHLWQDPIHHEWNEKDWPAIPFGTWRLWDAHVLWTYLEPARDTYDFSILDKYVQDAQDRHVQIVLTLQGTPAWASARPLEIPLHQGGVKGPAGSAAEPGSISDWENFVRTVAVRYKGKIHYYEVWNEPMSKPFFSGSPEAMVNLVRAASTTLKQVDPAIKVLSPPVSGDPNGLDWLKSFLNAGGGRYIDIYGFHFYVGGAPELALPKVRRARELLRSFDQDGKPMWDTEFGWTLSAMDRLTASNYVARALLVGWPFGLGRRLLYSWDHDQMGIAPNGNGANTMVQAYATVEHWLVGSVMTRCIGEADGLWVENLTFANGAQGKVVWSTSGQIPLSKDNIGSATHYATLDGQTFAITTDSNLQASGSPILLYSTEAP